MGTQLVYMPEHDQEPNVLLPGELAGCEPDGALGVLDGLVCALCGLPEEGGGGEGVVYCDDHGESEGGGMRERAASAVRRGCGDTGVF